MWAAIVVAIFAVLIFAIIRNGTLKGAGEIEDLHAIDDQKLLTELNRVIGWLAKTENGKNIPEGYEFGVSTKFSSYLRRLQEEQSRRLEERYASSGRVTRVDGSLDPLYRCKPEHFVTGALWSKHEIEVGWRKIDAFLTFIHHLGKLNKEEGEHPHAIRIILEIPSEHVTREGWMKCTSAPGAVLTFAYMSEDPVAYSSIVIGILDQDRA